jgi:type VI secretion system secreted protein Hcp
MTKPMYVTIKGARQGVFKGRGSKPDHGRIPITAFEWETLSPLDAASGKPSGRRKHKPVVFRKEVDAASPQILEALVTNETLSSALFEFTSVSKEGKETVDYTISLTNAAVAAFGESVHTGDQGGPPVDSRRLDQVTLTFQRIEFSNKPGGTAASDDWLGV